MALIGSTVSHGARRSTSRQRSLNEAKSSTDAPLTNGKERGPRAAQTACFASSDTTSRYRQPAEETTNEGKPYCTGPLPLLSFSIPFQKPVLYPCLLILLQSELLAIIMASTTTVAANSNTRATRSNTSRGRRTGVDVSGVRKDDSGMDNLDSYFAGARSAEKGDEKKTEAADGMTARGGGGGEAPAKKDTRQIRFSLPDAAAGTGSDRASGVGAATRKLITRHGRGSISPGDLSSVATADSIPEDTPSPAVPAAAVDDDNTNGEDEAVARQKSRKSTPITPKVGDSAFDDDEDDDGGDLLPPPPPSEEVREEQPMDDHDDDDFPIGQDDDDDIDDDKEGDGYLLTQEEVDDEMETPASAKKKGKRTKSSKKVIEESDEESDSPEPAKKSKKKQKKTTRKGKKSKAESESESSDEEITPPPKKQTKKKKKAPYKMAHFTPKGVQAGPREYTSVPISDFKKSPASEEKGLRRSRRAHHKPLEWWKNESYVWGPEEAFADEDKYDSLANMPVPKAINRAEPTPYKPRKVVSNNKKKPVKGGKRKKGGGGDSDDERYLPASTKPFDTKKLRKKYKFEDGEEVYLWDDCIHEASDMSKLCCPISTALPFFFASRGSHYFYFDCRFYLP